MLNLVARMDFAIVLNEGVTEIKRTERRQNVEIMLQDLLSRGRELKRLARLCETSVNHGLSYTSEQQREGKRLQNGASKTADTEPLLR